MIDQVPFHFSQGAGVAVAFMVGFLVFSVALDLSWSHFRRVLSKPKAPAIGLIAQFVLLPAVAFTVGMLMTDIPSVAIGLMLVACCPGGALSNYLTGVASGDVATSISMTAVSTLVCVLVTPLLFTLWSSLNPSTATLLHAIDIDPARMVMILVIMLVLPVSAGMMIRARHPQMAGAMRVWVRRGAGLVFAIMVAMVLGSNAELIVNHGRVALLPVLTAFTVAAIIGWLLARALGLDPAARRAVVFEVALQNVALAIALAVAFFPSLAGVAITAALWGAVHIVLGCALAVIWSRFPASQSRYRGWRPAG